MFYRQSILTLEGDKVGSRNRAAGQIKRSLLKQDIEQIKEMIAARMPYVLKEDINYRCGQLGLSAGDLAKRCHITRAAANKWLSGKASPCGKERMKELGMALEMDEEQLNRFLLSNAYPRLSSKNPLDGVCKFILRRHEGSPEIVTAYRDEVKNCKAELTRLPSNRVSISTEYLSKSLAMLDSSEGLQLWLKKFSNSFSATDKTLLPSRDFIRLAMLFLGEKNVHELYTNGTLPASVSRQLYPIRRRDELTARGLRKKLIVFGLGCNMAEQDLDTMLEYAGLLPFSQPKTKLDIALWATVCFGHGRYPLYEFDLLWQLHHDLVDINIQL